MAQGDTPYDRFFRSVFTRPELAWELTRIAAPELGGRLREPAIHVESGSLVDPEFRSHETDLLIRLTQQKVDTFVYVLYEHKSKPDHLVSLQLLRYLGAIWQRSRKDRSRGRLPQIIPIVIYHGRSFWKPTEFSRLVEGATGDHVPRFTRLARVRRGASGVEVCQTAPHADERDAARRSARARAGRPRRARARPPGRATLWDHSFTP